MKRLSLVAKKNHMVNGIKNIMRINYGIQESSFDWESEIDATLSYQENYNIVFEKLQKRGLIQILGGKKW